MSQIGALFGGLFGDAGQGFVDEQGGPDKVFGTKPDVAPFVPVNLSDETRKAVEANLSNYPGISNLLDKIIPGFSDMLAQGSENTLSELRGELPQDVQDQVTRSAAFKSISGGFGGTQMAGALTARDLGLTSLNLTQLGTNSAQMWSSIAEGAFGPFTVSTGQQAGTTAANNAGIQANKQFQFNVDAAPDPGAAGVFELDRQLGEMMLSFGLGAAGGAIAGGGAGTSAIGGRAPTGSGSYLYDPRTGSYTPASSGSSATNFNVSPTWGAPGG